MEVIITLPTGETTQAFIPASFRKRHEALPADEFLYYYLLANTPLKPFDEGLPDEEQKVLKYFGIKYWEPGWEEVTFQENIYTIINN